MHEAVIIDAVRTPIGKRNGLLKGISPAEMIAELLKELVNRSGISPELIDEIMIGGCVSQFGIQVTNLKKSARLIAGLPLNSAGTNIYKQCKSSQQAIQSAAQAILSGDMDIVIAAGVESVSYGPSSRGDKKRNSEVSSAKAEMYRKGVAAERIADIWGLTREQLDDFAIYSHQKAINAQITGRFDKEIIPVKAKQSNGTIIEIKQDSGIAYDTSIEKFATSKPSFIENGKIHFENSGLIGDGAAATLMMSGKKARELGLFPRFRIINRTVVNSDPSIMFTGLIIGTHHALVNAGITIDNIDVFEINEDFASVPLVWLQETKADPGKLNPNGGAIALGNPTAATGVRILTTMIHELERIGGRFGLIGLCESHGMVNVSIIERLEVENTSKQ